METVVNVTEQSNLPVQYGSEMPGIWLINWNITMHLNNPATRRRNRFFHISKSHSLLGTVALVWFESHRLAGMTCLPISPMM